MALHLPVSFLRRGFRTPAREPHSPQRLCAAAQRQQWHFQPFAGHESRRKELLRQELALVQVLVGRSRIMMEQK